MLTEILKGNVMARAIGTYKLGFASGTANRIAAGTAIYEALPHKTVNNKASPVGKSNNKLIPIPHIPATKGIKIAKPIMKKP